MNDLRNKRIQKATLKVAAAEAIASAATFNCSKAEDAREEAWNALFKAKAELAKEREKP